MKCQQNLVKYKFKIISVSIDGASDSTYKIYRKGGNFDKVIKNIQKINYFKKKYKSAFPKLRWQFVIFGHNEHELYIAREMAKESDMEFIPCLNAEPEYFPVKNKELVRKIMGAASRYEYEKQINQDWHRWVCLQLWFDPQINWDGKLLGCCCNIRGVFGNVFEMGLRNCVTSEKYIYTKRMLMGKEKPRKDIPCFHCTTYKDMLEKKEFINPFKDKTLLKQMILRSCLRFLSGT